MRWRQQYNKRFFKNIHALLSRSTAVPYFELDKLTDDNLLDY